MYSCTRFSRSRDSPFDGVSAIFDGSTKCCVICTASAVFSASTRIRSRKPPSVSLARVDAICETSGSLKGGGWLEIDGAASHHVRNQAVVGLGVLQDLDKLSRCRNINPRYHATRNKRDLTGQWLESLHRPIFILSRADLADGGVVDPMIVAARNTFTRGAGDDIGGNRPPGLGVVNVIPGEVPHRIMLVDASDVWPGRRQTRAAATRICHIPTSPAHASAARNCPGVTPISRRKAEFRWLWSAKPASCAIKASGSLVLRIRVFARSSRRCMT